MRGRRRILLALAAVLATSGAAAAEQVQVLLSDRLAAQQDRISLMEQRQALFLRNRIKFALSPARLAEEEARTERADYQIDHLLRRILEDALVQAQIRFEGTVQVTLERLSVPDFPAAAVAGAVLSARGTVRLIAPDGTVLESHQVGVPYIRRITRSFRYDGPHTDFLPVEERARLLPMLTYFAEAVLEAVFPEREDAIPGAITLQRRVF